MKSMVIVLLGHMGRDEALVDRLKGHQVHVLGLWKNPGLVEKSEASGGTFQVIDDIKDVEHIADLVQAIKPDMFVTNFDDSLAAGIVNTLRQRVKDKLLPELLIPCPDRETARVEWDKFFLRELIDEIDPKYNPANFMVQTVAAANKAIDHFESKKIEIAIKPRNLTGGKGVKVMGKHFKGFDEGRQYASEVLAMDNQTGLEVQEKIEGHEFTLQLLTDGVTIIKPPATYDYPYREDGDTGPGTGGMGTFSMKPGQQMPFMIEADYDEALDLMKKLLKKLKEKKLDYKGVLYPTFFKTSKGLKIVEVNARGGDPEYINILDLMEDSVDMGNVLKQIAQGKLTGTSVTFKDLASAMLYLVSPDYGYRKGEVFDFTIDMAAVAVKNVKVRFAATEKIKGNNYRTVGSSRSVGLSALGKTPWEARAKIHAAITEGFGPNLPLQYRQQVAEQAYIKSLVK